MRKQKKDTASAPVPDTQPGRATTGTRIPREAFAMREKLRAPEVGFSDPEIVVFGLHYFRKVFTPQLAADYLAEMPDNRGHASGQTRQWLSVNLHPALWHAMKEALGAVGLEDRSHSDTFAIVVVSAYCAKIKQPELSADFRGFYRIPVLKVAKSDEE